MAETFPPGHGGAEHNGEHEHDQHVHAAAADENAPHACAHAELPEIAFSVARSELQPLSATGSLKIPVLLAVLFPPAQQWSKPHFDFFVSHAPPRQRTVPANTRLLI